MKLNRPQPHSSTSNPREMRDMYTHRLAQELIQTSLIMAPKRRKKKTKHRCQPMEKTLTN